MKLNKTFEDQKDTVNSIIVPTILRSLDRETFPITSGVAYDILHRHHRHRREEFLKEDRSIAFKDQQTRRRHANSRRSDVSKKSVYSYLFLFF